MGITCDSRQFVFLESIQNTPQVPDSAAWAMFLRVHDELTLEMVNEKQESCSMTDLHQKVLHLEKATVSQAGWQVFLTKTLIV